MHALKLRLVTPTEVHKFASSQVNKLKELLSPQELLRFQTLKSEKRKRDWLAGRVAAKELLRTHLAEAWPTYVGVSLSQIEVYNGEAGAPSFRLRGGRFPQTLPQVLNISIAHSHGYGLCGLARTQEDGYIGVDIETIRPLGPAVQRRFLTEAELKQITGVESEDAVLFWALKEAAFKALRRACKFTSLQVIKKGDEKAVIVSSQGIALSAAYERHADFFLAWALTPPSASNP